MQGRGLGVGRIEGMGVDKATSVSDTNMAQCQHQYYVCAPSFSASHRVTDPPPLSPYPLPFPRPSLSFACTHSLKAAILAEKVVVWPDGAVFSSESTLSGAVGKGTGGSFLVDLKVV